MAKIYLTTNVNKSEPQAAVQAGHIHVKAKTDGSQTVIITESEVVDVALTEKTLSQAQAILDDWINEENQTPIIIDGVEVYQEFINLESYFA